MIASHFMPMILAGKGQEAVTYRYSNCFFFDLLVKLVVLQFCF